MDASVDYEREHIVLRAEDRWFAQPSLREAAGWAKENGWLEAEQGAPHTLKVPVARWIALGTPPDGGGPEQVDQWAFDHEAVCKLFGIRDEALSVQSLGHVGGASLKVQLAVNGTAVDAAKSAPPKSVDVRSNPLSLSPLAGAVVQLLKDFGSAPEHTRAEQLQLVAKLKRLRAAQLRLAEYTPRTRFHLDPHLDSYDISEPEKFYMRWADEGRNRVSLQLFIEGDDEPLPLGDLDEQSQVLERPGRNAVLLDAGTDIMARRARELSQIRRDKLGEEALRNPLALIPEGVETPRIDFSQYSHRVLGFEPAKAESSSVGYSSGTAWYDKDDDGKARIILTVPSTAGTPVTLRFEDATGAIEAARQLEQAAQRGESTELQGHRVRPDSALPKQLMELVRRHYPDALAPSDEAAGPSQADSDRLKRAAGRLRPVLADVIGAAAGSEVPPSDLEAQVPWPLLERTLAPHIRLKAHQRAGIAWLWHRYRSGFSGALLADDMGLGKTLQIASLIALVKLTRAADRSKRPTLIVAPVVLIENWSRELTKFFVGPFPGRLKELRDEGLRGLRLPTGQLDAELLKTFDIVIASYETLARYAKSLLGIDWDVVVLDEAHRIKNHGTQWSVAARGLSGAQGSERPRKFDFAVCATGTPVENAVTDLWALYDFLSPGHPFGSYEDFRRTYEKEERAPALLAAELRVGSITSSILRRNKAEALGDLPAKTYQPVLRPMTPFQHDQEGAIVRSPAAKSGGTFKILEQLQKLYQHPWLLDRDEVHLDRSHEDALAASPKLAACIEILEQIQAKEEKALIFTLWTRMQWLLKDVVEQRFKLPPISIINGDPQNRQRAQDNIQRLSEASGFGVMILSPLAAGVGLTITAANHVIHYGRWWNPAKEDQASDRAYRIGQRRPVTVYYPLLHHPDAPDKGFDVKLEELVCRKRAMARALLEPADDGDVSAGELNALLEARDG